MGEYPRRPKYRMKKVLIALKKLITIAKMTGKSLVNTPILSLLSRFYVELLCSLAFSSEMMTIEISTKNMPINTFLVRRSPYKK